jgi:transposase
MLRLADIDVYELVDALGKERSVWVSAAREEGRRPTGAERVTICALRALERAFKAAADKGRARDDWTART